MNNLRYGKGAGMDKEKIKSIIKTKKKIILAASLAAIALMVYGYTISRPEPQKTTAIPPVKADERVVAEGIVLPKQYSALSLPVGGVVAELYVKEGQQVNAGQLLARLVNEDIRAKVESARAELSRAKANYDQVKAGARAAETDMKVAQAAGMQATYDNARADYQRMRRLFEQGAVSLQQVEQYRAAFLKAKAELDLAQADLRLIKEGSRQEAIAVAKAELEAAQARLQESRTNLTHTELRAPFSGTISFLDAKVGEYVPAGSVFIQLADLSGLQIRTDDLTELSIARVKVGSLAILTFDAIPDLTIHGRVVHIRPFGEKKRGDMTYTVTIDPERLDPRLRWNMTVAVTIEK